MDRIAVGFDGSEPAFAALDWVAARAARNACRVDIITVNAPELFADVAIVDAARADAELRVGNRAPLAEVGSRTVWGDMPGALLETSQDVDLLVIGAHRRRPIRSALTGWLPFRTVTRSTVPTIVVPEDWSPSDGPVVVGVDADGSSREAVEFAAAEATRAGSGLTLLHAWHSPVLVMDSRVAPLGSTTEVEAHARGSLDSVYEHVVDAYPGLPVDKVLTQSDPASALLAAAARASLLVLGTHHRGPVSGVLGSVGWDAVWKAPAPVCIVPEWARTEAGPAEAVGP